MIEDQTIIPKVWRSEMFRLGFFAVSAIASVPLSRLFPASVLHGEILSIGETRVTLSLPLFWLLPAAALLSALYRIYNVRYAVDKTGIESIKGRLSFSQTTVRIRYEDIRSIETEQSIMERVFNVGTVAIGTAAGAGIEMELQGISSPVLVQRLIQGERDDHLREAQNSTGLPSHSDDEAIQAVAR